MDDFLNAPIKYYILRVSSGVKGLARHMPDSKPADQFFSSMTSRGRHELTVVNFLRETEDGLRRLGEKPYKLRHRRHRQHPNLVLLHYDQTRSDMHFPEVRESRGIVLDENNGWCPVCLPYLKFDNFNSQTHKISNDMWSNAVVYPKVDGTLTNLYYAYGAWQVATSNIPDGSGYVEGGSAEEELTFAKLFWEVWTEVGNPPASSLPTHLCFMFELNTPENRVIVPAEGRRLLLHGVRDMLTLQELQPLEIGKRLGLTCIQPESFDSIDAVVEAANLLSPATGEGFVVVYGDWERVKIKSRSYVLTALLPRSEVKWDQAVAKDPVVMHRLLRIVVIGEGEEFSCAFPHLRTPLSELRSKFDALVNSTEQNFSELVPPGIPVKEVVNAVTASNMPKPLQTLYILTWSGKVSDVRAGLCALAEAAPDSVLSLVR